MRHSDIGDTITIAQIENGYIVTHEDVLHTKQNVFNQYSKAIKFISELFDEADVKEIVIES